MAPDRPADPRTFTPAQNDILRRLRELERETLRLPEETDPLQTFENGKPLGSTRFLDFGAGIQSTLIGNDFVRISAASGGTVWDGIVDSELTASDPANKLFKSIGEAITYLYGTVGLTNRINLFVRTRATTAVSPNAYVETANVTATGCTVFIMTGTDTTPLVETGNVADIGWDHAGFVMTAKSWYVHGLYITGNGQGGGTAAKSALFVGQVYLEDCNVNPGDITKTSSRFLVSASLSILVRCLMNNGWCAFTRAYDSSFRIYTAGTYNPSNLTTFHMLDCELDQTTLLDGTVTWSFATVTTAVMRVTSTTAAPGNVFNMTASSGGVFTYENFGSTGLPRPIITSSASTTCILRGFLRSLTLGAPAASYAHSVTGTVLSMDVTGPALLDVHAESGTITIRGSRVSGHVTSRGVEGAGAMFDFISATRCRIDAVGDSTGSGGTYKAFAFDAGSSNNLLVMHRTSEFPAAGTDAGTNNVVLPYLIEDEGVAVAQRKTLNFVGAGVTVTDVGGKNVITIGGTATVNGHVIEDEGVGLTQRANLNFVGAGVTVTDASPDTIVTIPATSTIDGHVVEDEGTPLTQRANLNFVGAGVTVTDSAPDTIVTIPGGAGHTIQDEGVSLAARTNLNFVGAGVTVTDDAGNDQTDVTISGGGGGGGDTLVAWVGL